MEIKEQTKALGKICAAVESSSLLSVRTRRDPSASSLQRHWPHFPMANLPTARALQAKRVGKDAKMLLQVRKADQDPVLSLLEQCLAEGSKGLLHPEHFVPRAAGWWHVIPVPLPPHQGPSLLLVQGDRKLPGNSKRDLWLYQGLTFFTLGEFSVFSGKATSTKFPRWAPHCI